MISENDFANVCEYKTNLKGRLTDYIISFHRDEGCIESLPQYIYELFLSVLALYGEHDVMGRLVAKVNFTHVNQLTGEETVRAFHFPSYTTERIYDPHDFFQRHMLKIAERLDSFSVEGSHLILKNISHVHVHITKCS